MIKKKYQIFLLFLLFLVVRLINLTSVPIFNDESIYLHWGSFYFHNLDSPQTQMLVVDGKQTGVPLLYGSFQFLPLDPLVAGRLATVLLSIGTLVGGLFLAKRKIINVSPIVFGTVITFCPFILFFDRLALPDSIVTAAYTLSIVTLISLLANPSVKKGILLGSIIAFGWWFKSTILLIFPTLFLGSSIFWSKFPEIRKKLFFSIGTCLITFALLTSPLTLNPKYINSPHKDTNRLTITGVMKNPQKVALNLWTISQWFISTTTPFVFIAFIIGVLTSMDKIILLSAVFFPVIFVSIFLTGIMSRYILFITPVYLFLAIQGIMSLKKFTKPYLVISLISSIGLSFLLINSPLGFYKYLGFFPAAAGDFAQYFRSWPSGYGVKEAADFIIKKSQGKESVVFVRDDSGNPEDGIWAYLNKHENIIVAPLSKIHEVPPESAKYFVSRGPQFGLLEGRVKELKKFSKPLDPPDTEFVGIYEVI